MLHKLHVLSGRLAWVVSGATKRFSWRRAAAGLLAVMAAINLVGICSLAMGQADEPAGKQQSTTTKDPVGKPQPKDAKSESKVDDRKRFQPYGYVKHEHEIKISGRARNEDEEPVAGAHVFVVPVAPMGVAYGPRAVLAEGKTGADGRYHFDSVKLSVLEFAPQAVPRPSEALFQVFAVAEGYGYVWRRTHAYRSEKRPPDDKKTDDKKTDARPGDDQPPGNPALQHVFFANEPIVLDLEFSPEVRLNGTLSDDLGNPLKDAVVQVGLVNTDRDAPGAPPRTWTGKYHEDSPRGVDGQFNGYFFLPEEFRLARTDGGGRYEIRGVPRDCSLLAYLDFLPEYDPWSASLHTGQVVPAPASPRDRWVGYAGELNHVFVVPVTVRVSVLGHQRRPLANVVVRHESDRQVRRAGSLDRTDAQGTATLKLRPGKCVLIVEPTIGQPYLPHKLPLEFTDDPREHSLEVVLDSAAEVVLEAVEKETGKPIAGVAFLSEPADVRERQPVESQLSFVDHPRTDEQGRMQAFFEPGERRFFVDQKRSPHAFEPLAPTTEIIDLTPDKLTHLRFEFTRRPTAEPRVGEPESEPIADDLKPLAELLQRQAARFERSQRARFNVRHNNYLQAPLSREQMTQFLDSLASKTVEECQESIRGAFPDFNGFGAYEIITDGMRRRVEIRYPDQDRTEVNVFNGEETIVSMDAGRQLDIFGRDNTRIGFLAPGDFWRGPAHPYFLTSKQPAGEEAAARTIRRADGAWEIEMVAKKRTMRWIIDDATGFERLSSYFYGDFQSGQETRQLYPTLLATGVAVPKLSVRVHYQDAKVLRCEVTFIDKVELLESLPAEAFFVSAPAGTNIIDYRGIPVNELGGGRRAASGVVSAMVPDVVAHRNRFAPAGEPILKVGDEVPDLNVLTWLNAAGKADRPPLAGKVIVIDFWGISCGPCVAQLPEVNAAAKHFADSKIMIVGFHDSSGGLEQVVEFAEKRGLAFPIAIDKPDPKSQSFGATFAAFGINGIPSAVVIDGTGHVAYLGQFPQAIEVAHKLIQAK